MLVQIDPAGQNFITRNQGLLSSKSPLSLDNCILELLKKVAIGQPFFQLLRILFRNRGLAKDTATLAQRHPLKWPYGIRKYQRQASSSFPPMNFASIT